jgi:archaellum component FlaF (FlaF/FlaG flagellin family)/ribosomal protein L40E
MISLESVRTKLFVAQIFSILSLAAWLGLFLYYMYIFAMASTLLAASPFGGLFSGYLMSTTITYAVVFLILLSFSAIVVKRVHDMYNAANGGNIGRLKQLNSVVWSVIALIFSGVVPGVMLLLAQSSIDDLDGERAIEESLKPNVVDRLIKLKSLLNSGTITESEFKAQKEQLLYGESKNVSEYRRNFGASLGSSLHQEAAKPASSYEDPRMILKLRLAKGEITREQYEELKGIIQSTDTRAEDASAEEQLKNPKICRECGTPLPVDVRFCPFCGTPIAPSRVRLVAVSAPNVNVSHTKRMVVVSVIGLLLLALILVSAGSAYKPTQSPETQQSRAMMIMEGYNWNTAASTLLLQFRNVGSVPIDASNTNVFLNGTPVNGGLRTGCDATLTAGQMCESILGLPSETYVVGVAYPLKLVTPDGTVFSYSVIAGKSA